MNKINSIQSKIHEKIDKKIKIKNSINAHVQHNYVTNNYVNAIYYKINNV